MMQPLLELRIFFFPDSTVSGRTVRRDLGCTEDDVIQDVQAYVSVEATTCSELVFWGGRTTYFRKWQGFNENQLTTQHTYISLSSQLLVV
jgi:hypothetical protein